MRLLVDTHLAIWTITGDDRLTPLARRLLDDAGNEAFVSAVSIWEIAIKHRLARNPADMPFSGADATGAFLACGYRLLSVSAEHAVAVDDLPLMHGDPFDRLLLAQALAEPMRLMTHDKRLSAYSDAVILV